MALYPQVAAAIRQKAMAAFQADTIRGALVHMAAEALAQQAETGSGFITPGDPAYLAAVNKFLKGKSGISIDSGMTYEQIVASTTVRTAAVFIVASAAYGTEITELQMQQLLGPLLQRMGAPGSCNKADFFQYVHDNYADIIAATP